MLISGAAFHAERRASVKAHRLKLFGASDIEDVFFVWVRKSKISSESHRILVEKATGHPFCLVKVKENHHHCRDKDRICHVS